MTEPSGPPPQPKPERVADIRDRQQQRTSQAMAQLEQEHLDQMRAFGQRLRDAADDVMHSTKQHFLDERDQTLQLVTEQQATIRRLNQQLATSAKTSARMAWLPTLAICSLLIGGSLLFSWIKMTTANQAPAQTTITTIKGQTYEVLTGPNWTSCTYDSKTRPCRPTKG